MSDWKPLALSQPQRSYRYSVDALLLAAFALEQAPQRWLDIGTGCGVVAYYLGRCLPNARGVAVERQAALMLHARQNLADLPVLPILGDVRRFPWRPAHFDVVVCNPPYYLPGHGKVKKDPVAAMARHAFFGTVEDFAALMQPALRPDGRFCGVLPADVFARLQPRFAAEGWHFSTILSVRPFVGTPANLICFAMVRLPVAVSCSRELVLYRAHRQYTEAATAFFRRLTS